MPSILENTYELFFSKAVIMSTEERRKEKEREREGNKGRQKSGHC